MFRRQVVQSLAHQCFGAWKVGDSNVDETWGGIYLGYYFKWDLDAVSGWVLPKEKPGPRLQVQNDL